MRQCDHDMYVRQDTREEDAINHILFCNKKMIPVDDIRENLEEHYGYNKDEIDALFIKAGVQNGGSEDDSTR